MLKTVYLDNAATSFPKPKSVANAVYNAIEKTGGNPGRGGSRSALSASKIIFDARMAIADLFKIPSPERIVFTRNGTEGINIALNGLLKSGDRALISKVEHNSVVRPLASMKKNGIRFCHAACDKNGLPDPLKPKKAKMMVVTGASNVTGTITDIESLSKACRAKKIPLLIDAAQTAGSIPFNASCADILVCPGHKGLLGPQGTGFVWFSTSVDPEPMLYGGTGSDSEEPFMPNFWPDRFEAGTMNVPGIAGLLAGVQYIAENGIAAKGKGNFIKFFNP